MQEETFKDEAPHYLSFFFYYQGYLALYKNNYNDKVVGNITFENGE